MSGRFWTGLGAMWGVAALVGCGEDVPRDAQCSRICEKRQLCDSKTDEEDCVDDCRAQTYLSDTYMKRWAECVAPSSVSCDLAMDEEVVDDCVSDSLRREPVSALLSDVCRALSTKLAACDDTDPLRTETACRRGDSLKLSDAYLEASRECVDGLCSELQGCFDDLADDHNTSMSILPTASESSSKQAVELDGGLLLP